MARPKKVTAQSRLDIKAQYDAAGRGRRMKGWNPTTVGPNRVLKSLGLLRDRARDSAINDWTTASATQKWVTNLVGTGIVPRMKRITGTRKAQIHDLWTRWTPDSDADGVLDFYGQQALVARSWFGSGEVFGRFRVRPAEFGMEVPLQVQLIEGDFVPYHLDADTWPGMRTGNRIRQGIELDRRGQRAAYWVYREHPHDGTIGVSTVNNQDLLRIPASEMIHIYEPTRPGQLRGVPGMAPVLARLRSIGDYDDAVLERQKLANLFVAFITRAGAGDGDIDPMTNQPLEQGANGEALAGMQPGMTQVLDYGEDVKFANPPEAGTTYSDYMRTQHLGTSAAAGIPYEVMSGDIKEVSDRTLRVVINEFRRLAEQRQWHVLIPMFCQKVRNYWADICVVAGHISEQERNDVAMVEWSPHGWAHIHPVQDPQGKKVEVDAGFRSRSSVVASYGEDPEKVDEERAADVQREKDLGIFVDPNGQLDANGEPIVVAEPEDPDAPGEPGPVEQAQIRLLNAQASAAGRAPAEPFAVHITNSQPAVNVANHVPVPDVVVNNSVAAPNVNVVNEVPVPDVVVNNTVAAPNVNVVNEVQPSEVNVHLPTRKTESTVSYNSKGEIVNVSQIESDLDEAKD